MSHEATMWAVKVRGISCAEARVLWHLADCHNPVYGCYPKQDYLAEACELDVRSVRRSLDALRDKGHINWVEQREGKNRRPNRYSLAFEGGFRRSEKPEIAENEPDNLSASNADSTGHSEQFEPDISDGLNRTPESSIEPVREPVKEPVIERERASEVDGKKIEREFKIWYPTWPTYVGDSEDAARKEWHRLTPDDRSRCTERTPAFIAAVRATKGKFTYASVYLKGKAWEKLADPKSEVASPSVPNPFSKAWSACRLAELLKDVSTVMPVMSKFQQGELQAGGAKAEALMLDRLRNYGWPKVNTMHQRALNAQGVTVPAPLAVISESFVQVRSDSAQALRWKALHERKGWPWLPIPKGVEWLFFPAGEPEEAISEFERAISEGRGNDDAA
jgi:hypothetical protein